MIYEAMVDEWVRRSLPKVSTFADLVPILPGVYPAEVAASLQRQGINLPTGVSELLLPPRGPIPHPLDGDWRLHPDSHDKFLAIAKEQGAKRIALLGCPSLVDPLAVIASVSLVDSNRAWKPYVDPTLIEACWGDVSDALPHWVGRFDLAIADPPWYPFDFDRFLATAAALVAPGGCVVLSWPSEGTRPGMAHEWETMIEFAARMHLRLERRERHALRYATPFHEGCAIRAAGLPVLAAWRNAELVMFAREPGVVEHPTPAAPSAWRAVHYGALNLRIRTDLSARSYDVDPRLVQLIKGDILPTVSRRDNRRAAAMVWTAGNRIFGCVRPELFEAIVLGIAAGVPAPHTLARVLGRDLTQQEEEWAAEAELQVREVAQAEAADYTALHGPRRTTDC